MQYLKKDKTESTDGVTCTYYSSHIRGFSINKALEKQSEQLDYYSKMLSENDANELQKRINDKTVIPECINRSEELPVREINRYVPRGGAIEDEYLKLKK